MRRRDFPTDAAYYRAHRRVFLLAQELGCTPNEAEETLRRQEVHTRYLAQRERLAAKMNAPLTPGYLAAHDADEPRPAWWQRD